LNSTSLTGGLITVAVATTVILSIANAPQQTRVVKGKKTKSTSSFLWQKDEPPKVRRKAHEKWPTPKRIALGHSEGKGIGFDYGYTTLDVAFAPYYEKGSVLPIIDVNGAYFDNNTWEANVGVIARYIPKDAPVIPGLNMFYSWRETTRANYNMLTIGMELLGAVWDFRANGYIPLGQDKHTKKHKFKFPGGFEAESFDNQFALSGFNAEVGVQFFQAKNFFLYAAGGPYYLTGPFNTKTWGVEGRLQPQYNDYVTMNLSVSNDNIYGTIFRAELVLSLPLYNYTSMKKRSGPRGITNRQIYQPVRNFD
ncbi:MAG: inverse autotransporter beta domain-containing protein, partial [Chlamydiota bacterium]